MKRRRNLLEAIALFFELHWLKIVIVLCVIGSVAWPVLTLSSIDSYQRTYLVAVMSMTPIQSILGAVAFVALLYWLHYGGGRFCKLSQNKVKGEQVNVKWDDVIGMEEAKQE